MWMCFSVFSVPSYIPVYLLSSPALSEIMWQGVNHVRAWGALGTRGFWRNTFVSNTREKATAGSGVQTESTLPQPGLTRPFFFFIFFSSSIFSLWPLNSSNHVCELNSDPWNKDPRRCPMQTKCTTILEETLSLASSNRSKYPFLLPT